MDDFYWLDQIQLSDRPFVGDKAFYLGQLAQQGYPVIPGFVISAKVFRQFLETIHWLEPLFADLPSSSLHLDVNNSRQLQTIAQQIRQTIQATPIPADWFKMIEIVAETFHSSPLILRPSIGLRPSTKNESAKQAGIVNGLLDAQICWSEPDAIVQGLKQLWAELFRARSLFYWQNYNVELQQIHLAVLVQPLMPAAMSGSVQTSHTLFEVQSTWGLGLALKQGDVIPDLHQICARSGHTQTQRLGSKMLAYQVANPTTETALSFPSPSFAPNEEVLEHSLSEQTQLNQFTTYTTLVATASPCLQPYLPTEQQQQQFALGSEQLQTLTQLIQRLVSDLGSLLSVEWVIAQNSEDRSLKLHLTQVQLRSSFTQSEGTHPHPTEPETEVVALQQKILSGVAAAAGRVIAKAQVFTTIDSSIEVIPGSILVAPTVTPDWLPLLKHAVGVIAEQGGMTSHSAIIARELGIPAVVGATNATQLLQTGENILLNGDRGEVYRVGYSKNSSPKEDSGSGKIGSRYATEPMAFQMPLASFASPIQDLNMIATQLMVNLSQPEVLEQVIQLPVDGVGLLRSELLLLNVLNQQHPNVWLQQGRRVELVNRLTEQIRSFAAAFSPKPVFYRSLDLRSHEFRHLDNPAADTATNPMLGLRGTLSYQHNPDLFDVELEALAKVQASFGNIRLILPFVRTVEEFQFCQQRVAQAGLQQNPYFQLWIMAEVPSVLFLLPQFVAAGVQGISIGTNDLTQLLLGVDRDYPPLAKSFDERHPAILQAIAHLIRIAQKYNIPCSICGEAPARYPDLIERLVEWGITSISVDPNAVETTYRNIARSEQRLLLRNVRQHAGIDRSRSTDGLL